MSVRLLVVVVIVLHSNKI